MIQELANLDTLDGLDRGIQPPPEPPAPDDTNTAAKVNWTAAGVGVAFGSSPGRHQADG
jgi:hypothetical protein